MKGESELRFNNIHIYIYGYSHVLCINICMFNLLMSKRTIKTRYTKISILK